MRHFIKFSNLLLVGTLLVLASCNYDDDLLGGDGLTPPSSTPSEPTKPLEPSTPVKPSEPIDPSKPSHDDMTFYRPKTQTSQVKCDRVFEYLPAPGQFINELKTGGFDGTQTTMEAANEYAMARIEKNIWVSLGAFGGYIVVGFDHSILNTGGYDFAVTGNSFQNSSEPGIVWVMKDENGDGLPNDTWYELAGSEYGQTQTIQNYEVTYYRPTEPKSPVRWTDNQGGSGEVDYLESFHDQDYYYPLWVEEDSYTLKGTKLLEKSYDQSGNGSYWVLPEFEWGYADNFSKTDRVNRNSKDNRFMISNAVDADGNEVILPYIDFVKVQTGVQAKCGWLGETSTEIQGVYNIN